MAVQVHNICYTDANEALMAIRGDFPIYISLPNNSTATGLYLSSSFLDISTGLFQYNLKNQVGNTVAIMNKVYYSICDDNNANLSQTLPDLAFIIGLLILFALGFIAGKFR